MSVPKGHCIMSPRFQSWVAIHPQHSPCPNGTFHHEPTISIVGLPFTHNIPASQRDASIPQIGLVDNNTILFDQFAKFVLKRLFAMMLFLVRNVLDQLSFVRGTHRKRTIPYLPSKLLMLWPLLFDLLRARAFDFL